MSTFIESFNDQYSQLINELYVGETPFIRNLIEEVSKARAPYIGKLKRPIKGNKDFIKIGDMIAKEFGFYAVTFMVPYDTSMNAFTYPITKTTDRSVIGIKPKFIKDTGLKYESPSDLCIIVAVTAGVWFNKNITDREVVAALLHEIGHSFVTQSERLINILEASRVALISNIIYKIIMDIYTLNVQDIPDDIKMIINTSNKGKEIINQTARECAENPLFAGYNSFDAILEYVGTVVGNVFKEISMLISGPMKLISIPVAVINSILSLLSKSEIAADRSQEYLSDSFASMYGLGPELSSFLTKIEYSPSAAGSHVERIINSIPVIGAINEACGIPVLLIMNNINTHPSTPARIRKILEELNKELNNSDLSPKTKAALRKNIEDLEKIKDDCLNPPKNKKFNAVMVKRAWASYLMDKEKFSNDIESYYTDLRARDAYVKENFIPYPKLI